MPIILIAHQDAVYSQSLAAALSGVGYDILVCPTGWDGNPNCLQHLVGSCPLVDAADLMLYDPEMEDRTDPQHPYVPALGSAQANPAAPLLLCDVSSPRVGRLLEELPTAKIAEKAPEKVVAQVASIVGPPTGARWMVGAEVGRD